MVQTAYDYAQKDAKHKNGAPIEQSVWHVNFADRRLFGCYGSSLFAQDELQVGEHPALACVREDLLKNTHPNGGDDAQTPLTTDEKGPTPCVLSNVPRVLNIDTTNIWGGKFVGASREVLSAALNPTSSVSNIIAIEAPKNGKGSYTLDQIVHALSAAYTGFYAAV